MLSKGNFLLIKVKAGKIRFFFPLPLFLLKNLIWDFIELFDLIGWKSFTSKKGISFGREQMIILTEVLNLLASDRSYDLVDVDVVSPKENVKVKIRVL